MRSIFTRFGETSDRCLIDYACNTLFASVEDGNLEGIPKSSVLLTPQARRKEVENSVDRLRSFARAGALVPVRQKLEPAGLRDQSRIQR